MRLRFTTATVALGAALALGAVTAPSAFAEHGGGGGGGGGGGRPGGPPVTANGVGTLGTPWKLKSMHDDTPAGAQVVGEEFEIAAQPGQTWTVTFADNGVVFFSANEVSTATGVRVVQMTANQPGFQHMTAHAVDQQTGEVIDGAVDLPPLSGSHGG